MAKEKERAITPSAPGAQGKPAAKWTANRIALLIVLVLLIAVAIPYLIQAGRYRRAVRLYEEDRYAEAEPLLEGLRGRMPVSLILGGRIRKLLGLCKAEAASDIALKDRSAEGYAKALALLEEAAALAGRTEEIQRRITEYSGYKTKLEAAASPAQGAEPLGAGKP